MAIKKMCIYLILMIYISLEISFLNISYSTLRALLMFELRIIQLES